MVIKILRHRFLFGGFPSFFVQKQFPEDDFQEWIDAYWAKDIQDMFRVGKRSSFQKFTELLLPIAEDSLKQPNLQLLVKSAGRTIANYLDVLEETFVVHVIQTIFNS